MTEEEAKNKWCPFVRFTHPNPDADIRCNNRGTGLIADDDSKCIGSKCMAWRFVEEAYTPKGGDPLATMKPVRKTKQGYCGLAGRQTTGG